MRRPTAHTQTTRFLPGSGLPGSNPSQEDWAAYETIWGQDGFFRVAIIGNYRWDGSQYSIGDSRSDSQPRYTFPVDPTGPSWPDIETDQENTPPVLTLLAPNNQSLHRQATPEFEQDFSVRATDADGHNWTAEVQVRDPDGSRFVNEVTPRTGSGSSTSTAQHTMPHKNGTYTWRARATDTSGLSDGTAQGDWVNGSFEFIWNLPPEVPELIAPAGASELVVDTQPPTFVIETTDPEQDAYAGTVEVRSSEGSQEHVVQTTSAASGTPAVAQLDETLDPGEWEWRASATDILVSGEPERSDFSDWQSFEVARTVANEPPEPPELVAPDGETFGHGDDQVFTIATTDPDGDDYLGMVTVTDTASGVETSFTTELTASGSESSGSPPVPLPAGDYDWSAIAVDSRGGPSEQSPQTSSFSVEGPPPDEPPTVALVAPDDGHEHQHDDLQAFTVRGDDPEGGPYRATVLVNGAVACETPLAPSGEEATCLPAEPVEPGSHTWTARAIDVHGNEGNEASARSFEVLANRAPDRPTQVEPDDGHVFRVGAPQAFAINATDPDGDAYRGEVTVRDAGTGEVVATVDTAEVPSGFDSYGVAAPPLEPGSYTWSAAAIDVGGERSSESPSRPFTVNRPPDAPTLVAPDADGFDRDEPQVFTINATDPDGDPYSGTVRVLDADTGEQVREFPTMTAPSGEQASGMPSEALPAGDYTWEATASDIAGARSDPGGPVTFTVRGNRPPDVPELVSPESGGGFDRDEPQTFTVTYADPDGDPGYAEVFVDSEPVCRTPVVTSGQTASCTALPPVEAGDHSWTARNVDAHGHQSGFAPARVFTVQGNQPPGAPALVAPADGETLTAADAQVFTVNAVDPDGDAYTGTVRIFDVDTGEQVREFPTAPAASGQDASGVPPQPLASGSYEWHAEATDVHGATGEQNAQGAFTVEGMPDNRGPIAALVAPDDGHEFDPGDEQLFTVAAVDPEGDDWAATVTITETQTGVVASTFTLGPAASGEEASGTPLVALPDGSYQWSATPVDTQGNLGATTDTRAFTVGGVDNRAPDTPTQLAPEDGHVFAENDPLLFAMSTTDPEGDPWFGTVQIRDGDGEVVREFPTSPAASGEVSTGLAAPLPPGDYEWRALATDVHLDASDPSGWRGFEVVLLGVVSQPPDAPTLIDPADGSTHNRGQPDRFTVNATDPDHDPYSATITIREVGTDCDGPVADTFETPLMPSGVDARGTPNDIIEPGAYCWSATATDVHGATGPPAEPDTFTVQSIDASTSDGPLLASLWP